MESCIVLIISCLLSFLMVGSGARFSMIGTTNIGLTYRPTDIEPGGIMVLRSCNIVNDQVDLSGLVRVKTTVREKSICTEE